MINLKHVLFFLILIFGLEGYGQDTIKSFATSYNSEVFDTPEVPERLTFGNISIDSDNNKWICTNNGVIVMFDGQNWKMFNQKDSLPSNHYSSVFFDSNNGIWTSSDKDYYKFDGKFWRKITDVKINSYKGGCDIITKGISLRKIDNFYGYKNTDKTQSEILKNSLNNAIRLTQSLWQVELINLMALCGVSIRCLNMCFVMPLLILRIFGLELLAV